MNVRSVAFAAVFAYTGTATAASATPAQMAPGPSVAAACAAAGANRSYNVESAFSYDLNAPAMLHFITQLADASEATQRRVLDAASAAAGSPDQTDAQTALGNLCPSLDVSYGNIRADALVSARWTIKELNDTQRSDDLSSALATAIGAFGNADRLTPKQYSAAMAPFGALFATPATVARSCAGPDAAAHTSHAIEPVYPSIIPTESSGGSLLMKVRLTDAGDVRSVNVFDATFDHSFTSQALVRSTFISVAATTYEPAVVDCKSVASTLIFRSDFHDR